MVHRDLLHGDVEAARPERSFTERVWIAGGAATALAGTALLLVFAFHVFLFVFAGILLGAVLRGLSRLVMRTGASYHVAFGIVVLTLILLTVSSVWLMGSRIASQVDALIDQFRHAREQAIQWLSKYEWGRAAVEEFPSFRQVFSGDWNMMTGLNVLFASVTGVFTGAFLVIMFGLYFAADPGVYEEGIIRLVPLKHRDRAREILMALPDTLCAWALGRLASMAIIGIGAAVGLWFLKIPLPLTLGLFAGLATFVPNVGGFVGVVPPALLALQQDSAHFWYVIIFFIVLQAIESNLLTPLIQQRQVSVPPGLLLAAQLLMGSLAGLLGLALATPLAAMALVLVRKLYVVDTLGDPEVAAQETKKEMAVQRNLKNTH